MQLSHSLWDNCIGGISARLLGNSWDIIPIEGIDLLIICIVYPNYPSSTTTSNTAWARNYPEAGRKNNE